jgi:hypothetical protein
MGYHQNSSWDDSIIRGIPAAKSEFISIKILVTNQHGLLFDVVKSLYFGKHANEENALVKSAGYSIHCI